VLILPLACTNKFQMIMCFIDPIIGNDLQAMHKIIIMLMDWTKIRTSNQKR